jgi:SHS2 domain-containing protein
MYEFLDHPSEALIRVRAATVDDIFREAAIALFEIMTDTKKIHPAESYQIQASATERHLLLIDWLNNLILLHESKNIFFSNFEVNISQKNDWHLKATVKGEKVQSHHEKRSHAKSATYGQLQWIEKADGHEVLFVIDI